MVLERCSSWWWDVIGYGEHVTLMYMLQARRHLLQVTVP